MKIEIQRNRDRSKPYIESFPSDFWDKTESYQVPGQIPEYWVRTAGSNTMWTGLSTSPECAYWEVSKND